MQNSALQTGLGMQSRSCYIRVYLNDTEIMNHDETQCLLPYGLLHQILIRVNLRLVLNSSSILIR